MRDNEVDTKKKMHVRKWRWLIGYGDDKDRGGENNFQVSSLSAWVDSSNISHYKKQRENKFCLGMVKMGGREEKIFFMCWNWNLLNGIKMSVSSYVKLSTLWDFVPKILSSYLITA